MATFSYLSMPREQQKMLEKQGVLPAPFITKRFTLFKEALVFLHA